MDQSDEAMPRCMSTGAIAGIAVGGSIMIILIIIIIVICCTAYQRRKRARIIKVREIVETFRIGYNNVGINTDTNNRYT